MSNKKGSKRSEKSRITLETVSIIANIVLALTAVYVAIQANKLAESNLTLQNMMSNFTSVIIPEPEIYLAILDKPSSYISENGTIIETSHYGYLNVNFLVITAHVGVINITIKNFNVHDSENLNPERLNETKVTYTFDQDKYAKAVASGITPVNFSLHLNARVYPNASNIPPEGQSRQFLLGLLILEAELTDLQAKTRMTEEIEARICVVMETTP